MRLCVPHSGFASLANAHLLRSQANGTIVGGLSTLKLLCEASFHLPACLLAIHTHCNLCVSVYGCLEQLQP